MFNQHLLQKHLTVEEYEALTLVPPYRSASEHFPAYIIARCPYCSAKNIEKIDTYSVRTWRGRATPVSTSIGHPIRHCTHFTIAQYFFRYYETLSCRHRGFIRQGNPYVVGHLLESSRCLAVMHALPICRIEDNEFIPHYTLFMISYFSENSKETIQDIHRFNVNWYAPEASGTLHLPLQFGDKQWADLNYWVSIGKLFWVDGNDAESKIYTNDAKTFPYGDVANIPIKTKRKFCIRNNSKSDLLLHTDLQEETIKVKNGNVHTFDLLGDLSNVRPKLTISTQGLTVSFLHQPERSIRSNGIMEMLEIENIGNAEVSFTLQSGSWSLRLQKGDVVQFWDLASVLEDGDGENVTWGYVPMTVSGTNIVKGNYISISPVTGKYEIFQNGREITKSG